MKIIFTEAPTASSDSTPSSLDTPASDSSKKKKKEEPTILGTLDYNIKPTVGTKFALEFCEVQPQIREYALRSPEHMATILLFVLASIKSEWGQLLAYFPNMMYRLLNGGKLYDDKNDGLSFGPIIISKSKQMQMVWDERVRLYHLIAPLIDKHKTTHDEALVFELYKTLARLKMGMGLPKAAFATQMLIGRLGCIDSINQNIYRSSLPLTVASKAGEFKNLGLTASGENLTKGSLAALAGYQQFIDNLFNANTMETSRILWNNWTEIVAERIKFRGRKGVILIKVTTDDGVVKTVPVEPYMLSSKASLNVYKGRPELSTASGVSGTHYPPNIDPKLLNLESSIKTWIKEALKK